MKILSVLKLFFTKRTSWLYIIVVGLTICCGWLFLRPQKIKPLSNINSTLESIDKRLQALEEKEVAQVNVGSQTVNADKKVRIDQMTNEANITVKGDVVVKVVDGKEVLEASKK